MSSTASIQQVLARPENTCLVRDLLADPAIGTRNALAREVCQRLALRDPRGALQISTAAKALRDLEAQGLWKLPPPTQPIAKRWTPQRLAQRVPPPKAVPPRVEAVEGLHLLEATTDEHLQLWNELILREHPLHQCRLVGRQLRYLVGSDHGWLGAIGFGSASLYLEDRDTWIGWSQAQRMEHRPRVLNMNRFLIRPRVHCENLASRVLALCAQQVARDFERRYGLEPWLLESFVDGSQYDGACYKAANWVCVGQTKGRGRNGRAVGIQSIKDIYLYPLVEDVPRRMGVEPVPIEPLDASSGLDAQSWAQQEFGTCPLGDPRRTERLVKIVSDQAAQPGASYSQASGGDRHELKAYYRFLNSKREDLSSAVLLQAHRDQTIRRMQGEAAVLIVQDTMELNYSTRKACDGLGVVGTNQTGTESRGLDLHTCLAVGAESGLPLGVVRFQGYAPESAKGKDPHRPIEEKESYRWLQGYEEAARIAALIADTQIVCVTDREGDIFEMFDLRRRRAGRKADILVRANYDRCLAGSDLKLFAELAAEPLAQTVSISVPRQRQHPSKASVPGRPGLAKRQATVEIRFKEVLLAAPQSPQTRHLEPLKIWAIHLKEKAAPKGATPLHWLLLTTLPVCSVKQALKLIRWYRRRWRIEEWHRVMKSGCKILEHQNHSAEVLLRTIALDAVIAWRIMLLTLLSREVPGLPAENLFDPGECEVLGLLSKKKA